MFEPMEKLVGGAVFAGSEDARQSAIDQATRLMVSQYAVICRCGRILDVRSIVILERHDGTLADYACGNCWDALGASKQHAIAEQYRVLSPPPPAPRLPKPPVVARKTRVGYRDIAGRDYVVRFDDTGRGPRRYRFVWSVVRSDGTVIARDRRRFNAVAQFMHVLRHDTAILSRLRGI